MKIEPQFKSLNYLKKKRWSFEDDRLSAMDLKNAFVDKRWGYKTLPESIVFLLTRCKDWEFYTLNDIEKLNEARKIFIRNYEK